MVSIKNKYKMIDLFSGCGGMTSGFVQTGSFEPVWSNDFNHDAIKSYKANFDPDGEHTVCGDIVEILNSGKSIIPTADVVIGGPPCQGFSLLNKQRKNDSRRSLWQQFLNSAQLANAKVIVMENVSQLFSSPEFILIRDALYKMDFKHISANVLNTANYGVPQRRKRTIILASRIGWIALPKPTHAKRITGKVNSFSDEVNLKNWCDVRSAIGDLSAPVGTEIKNIPAPLDLHFGRNPRPESLERYKAVPPGGNRFDLQKNRPDITPNCWLRKKSGGTDLFGRLWWDRPSVTIRTEFFKPEKGRYLHPDQHRPITHREAARIQSFSDSFIFKGSKIEVAKQIGNAVPPLLSAAIAQEVINCLEGVTNEQAVRESETLYTA